MSATLTTSDLEIVQMALGNLGSTETVTSISSPTTKAEKLAALYYPRTRDRLLKFHDWSWATKRSAALSVLADHTRAGWTYCYTLPTDCLKVIDIDQGYRRSGAPGSTGVLFADGRERWEVEQNNTGDDLILLCDASPVSVVYVQRVVSPTLWSVEFQEAVTWMLAARLAMPLAGKGDLAKGAYAFAAQALSDAVVVDVSHGRPDPTPDSAIITSRSY